MKFLFSFGKKEIQYFIMIGFASTLFYFRDKYELYSDEKKKILGKSLIESDKKLTQNKLLQSLLKYVGFSLMIIGDIIRNKISSIKKKDFDKNLLVSKKYNLTKKDSKYLIKKKDIFFILLISLAQLFDEFLAILIKTVTEDFVLIDELFNSIKFFFLYCTSFYIFKVHYYRHQYISIIIIISLEIFRYLIKGEYKDVLVNIGLQLIRGFINSLFIGYSKGLMEYNYFSPYKVTYIFGFINGVIIIIIYSIVSYKPVKDASDFCSLKYENKCYFDNYKSIFKEFSFNQFLGLFIYMISVTGSKLLLNIITNDFTICHTFTYFTLNNFIEIIKSIDKDKLVFSLKVISSFFEILVSLVFLEIIIINLWGLNKNVKINIKKRALLDSDTSEGDTNGTFDVDDEYEIDYEDINKDTNTLKKIPLVKINEKEGEEEKN